MIDRRGLLARLLAVGIGAPVFCRAIVAAMGDEDELTVDMIKQAEWITGLEMTDEETEEILNSVNRTGRNLDQLREIVLSDSVPMALHFTPIKTPEPLKSLSRNSKSTAKIPGELPGSDEKIAFLPVAELAKFVESKRITSLRLTKIYLDRLKKYAPMLRSVVTLTEELAIKQAKQADAEIAAGKYRGPLHGIPWGAKDLMAVPGYPTTYGIPFHKDRELEGTATVVQRLEDAGAVLVAKLSLGALAMGDKWFEGMTRNPWNPKIGSSGSSAGSASCVIAGLVGFTLGTETLGSIVSPSVRCGASSLRPTFGRVSRHGCMPLSWSLDKVGPICRSLEDCALVFDAIHGSDDFDETAGSYPFAWPSKMKLEGMKIGYAKSGRRKDEDREELNILKKLGCELVELKLPTEFPLRALTTIIDVEAASVFDDLLRAGETDGWNTWTRSFQAAQFVSAVDYVRIQRTRTLLMKKFEEAIAGVDAMVNMNDLLHTNFTGHPSIVLPIEYRAREEAKFPRPVILTGHLHDDERLLALGNAFQAEIDAHRQHPDLDFWQQKFEAGTLDETKKEKDAEDK